MKRAPSARIDVATWLSLRFIRDSRYYALHLEQDPWGEWILTRVNGRRGTRLGRAIMQWSGSLEAGLASLALSAKRRSARGYMLSSD
jgi:hypothetical protein